MVKLNKNWRAYSRNWLKEANEMPVPVPGWLVQMAAAGRKPPVLSPEEVDARHKNNIIFVFGNGPSLLQAAEYRSQLAQHITIGTNVSFLYIASKYLLFGEKWVWVYCMGKLMKYGGAIFYPGYHKRLWRMPFVTQFSITHHKPHKARFTESFKDGLFAGGTGMTAANLAYIMGASQIALVGIDLYDNTHFYTGKERELKHPVFSRLAKRYPLKRDSYPGAEPRLEAWPVIGIQMEKAGVKIWNCSKASKLDCFEKIELGRLLEKIKPPEKVETAYDKRRSAWLEASRQ